MQLRWSRHGARAQWYWTYRTCAQFYEHVSGPRGTESGSKQAARAVTGVFGVYDANEATLSIYHECVGLTESIGKYDANKCTLSQYRECGGLTGGIGKYDK